MMSARDKKKDYLVPRLRFPEFRDTGEWGKVQLSKIAIPVSERATDGDADAVLTLSAEHGVVTQGSYFGKKIAGDDVTRYIKIKNNDFVYNDRTTKFYKYGTIKRLSRHTYGIVSPIYKCFRFNDEEIPVFWEWYFESGEHDTQLHNIVNEGAKAGRFNISIQKFLSIFVYFPDKSEQQRIADCLSSLDERIAAETNKLDTLKDHKKGLLKQLFPAEGETLPQLRFPEFGNSGKWQKIALGDICDIIPGYTFPECLQGKIHGIYPFCKVSDISKAVSEHGGLLDRALNYVGDDELSILKAKPLPVGTTVFAKIGEALRLNRRAITTVECLIDNNAVGIKAKSKKSTDYFLYTLSQLIDLSEYCGGAVPAVNKTVLENISVVIPTSYEQQRIADCLSSLDALIASQTQKIDLLKDHKKGLMQQLFPCIDEVRA